LFSEADIALLQDEIRFVLNWTRPASLLSPISSWCASAICIPHRCVARVMWVAGISRRPLSRAFRWIKVLEWVTELLECRRHIFYIIGRRRLASRYS